MSSDAPQPASIGIYCKGQKQLAYLDAKSGLYFCGCCGVQVPVCW